MGCGVAHVALAEAAFRLKVSSIVQQKRNDRKPVKNRLFQSKSGLYVNRGDKKLICVMDGGSIRDYAT